MYHIKRFEGVSGTDHPLLWDRAKRNVLVQSGIKIKIISAEKHQ